MYSPTRVTAFPSIPTIANQIPQHRGQSLANYASGGTLGFVPQQDSSQGEMSRATANMISGGGLPGGGSLGGGPTSMPIPNGINSTAMNPVTINNASPYIRGFGGYGSTNSGTLNTCGSASSAPGYTSQLIAPQQLPERGSRRNGPVAFSPDSLPIPCAYIKLPWPLSRKIARLLPPKEIPTGPTDIHRQYIKRMIVEEVCVDPAAFLLRYCHYSDASSPLETRLESDSRLNIFHYCREIFPSIQVMSLQHQGAEFDGSDGDTLGSTRVCVINQNSINDRIFTVHHLIESWRRLPVEYELWESLWVSQIVPKVVEYFQCGHTVPTHLAILLDCSVHNRDWQPHCMRLVSHMIAQIVSVAHSCIPMYLRPNQDALGFASFQIVVMPPTRFNEAVAQLRIRNDLERAGDCYLLPASGGKQAEGAISSVANGSAALGYNPGYDASGRSAPGYNASGEHYDDGTVITHHSQKIVSGTSKSHKHPFCGFNSASTTSETAPPNKGKKLLPF
ncbi:hypothetical protein GNI_102160 [Gregarina niphandrodes]|uniref:Uncharacterized protein n=1 Tax=Gregarina niphandrodes TaxID=110365 RepID=A0A023B4D7_GRENI|nr:hypothetical protein GNI_102160 [Gregarina niphandrodes]EZG56676.1 hypothetical protein GNI_102160 [Gregarina niphandrodes]|eukprot:XP_011131206.1 hypothetical protein GNI_102160 [Gregarina niphandrodes]